LTELRIETPHGLARAHLWPPASDPPRAALILGHGAGVGVDAPDIVAAAEVATAEDLAVALVEQPYWVAGRRSPAPAAQLDAAWVAVVEHLKSGELDALPLILGGRSLGARVACRNAEQLGAVAVLCLAFPFQPHARGGKPDPPSRLAELDSVPVPTLVVQGERDQFGMPPAGPQRTVAKVPGNHGLKADLGAVAEAVREWLAELLVRIPG
jgi:predicted alpha/beta-hydrolase family hydrolase